MLFWSTLHFRFFLKESLMKNPKKLLQLKLMTTWGAWSQLASRWLPLENRLQKTCNSQHRQRKLVRKFWLFWQESPMLLKDLLLNLKILIDFLWPLSLSYSEARFKYLVSSWYNIKAVSLSCERNQKFQKIFVRIW